ncbi:rab-GTPase-TBC domain-containing protein [Mucor lusitanicus]|nr:rab-GTPase-TBC domain-containing protein [Mucor lusitanicus]
MGYCEGVIGNFNAESVHFVELDPRVLESLDADLDHSQYRNSASSYGTTDPQQQQGFTFRDSLQSYSSSSDHHPLPHMGQPHWASGKPSFESFGTNNSSSISHLPIQQQSHISSMYSDEQLESSNHDPYDTSAFNINYSDEEDETLQHYPAAAAATNSSYTPRPTVHPSPPANTQSNESEADKSPASYSSSSNRSSSESNHVPIENLSVDEYGFVIKANHHASRSIRSNMTSKLIKEYRENELKWLSIVNKLDAGTVKKDAKFKKLVRSGIPASVRSRVWQFLAGSNDYRKPNQFSILVQKPRTKIYHVIERDIARCYPDHTQFMDKHGQGQKDLSTVLKAYSQYNSHLEYCQGMGRLAGLMLMQMTVEDTFWLLVATIDRYMNGYFTPTLSQLRIDAYIIGQLLKDHSPKLAQHLESNDVLPIMYIAQWFLTAFTMTLPWDSVLRVWDAFYFEGIKVFYRVSLAIMDICKDHLLNNCPTNSELLAFLLHIPHEYLQPNTLLESAFRINLSKTDIKRYAKRAGSEDATTSGLPFEHGIKNLQVGNSNSHSLGFKSLGGKKISKKSSNSSSVYE